jgi:hypothetical protein
VSSKPVSSKPVSLKPRLVTISLVLTLFATACGSGSAADTVEGAAAGDFVLQGEESLEEAPPTTTTESADQGSAGAAEGGTPDFDTTEDTIPQEEEDPDSEFFDAVGEFMACLGTEGYTFLGIPSAEGDPNDPVNDPGYRSALGDCAALTQIVSKMEAAEDTSDLTAEEIETQNRQFGIFVDCLIGRGWTIPTPTPDDNGVLQPRYIEIAQTWIPPDGTPLLSDGSINTDDFAECGFDPNNPPGVDDSGATEGTDS